MDEAYEDHTRERIAHMANVTKFEQLIKDAQAKINDSEKYTDDEAQYWFGMRDGLRRALNVIEGKG